jgi:hypothetical protein
MAITRHLNPRLRLSLAAIVAIVMLAGCAGAPIQEMSDARQAIRAAERAGAAQYAPEPLAEAKKLVEQARSGMQQREYREARDHAERAREKAVEARRIAESQGAPPPPKP